MKIYIKPQLFIQQVVVKSVMLQISISEKEISSANAGLVKEDVNSSTPSYNVWDDDWSK